MVFKIVVLLALAAMLVSDAEGTCMAGFQSYQGSCYWLSREIGDYGFARSICGHFGAHLATIHSAGEDSFLRRIIRTLGSNSGACYYLGGSDLGVENIWKWEGQRKSFTYTNWGNGEPSHTPGGQEGDLEHCLDLLELKGYTWNDDRCHRQCNFICEYKQ